MVKGTYFLVVILALVIMLTATSLTKAQTRVYSFDHQWAQISINQDGTIDLTYNMTLTLKSGTDIHAIDIGQPNSDFTIGQSVDQNGNQLSATDDSSGNDYKVLVTLNQPLTAGDTIWFTVATNVGGMISNDTMNPGNFGMEFAPEWMSVPINDVRVQIVLPPNVGGADVKTTQNFYNSTSIVDGRLAVYWQKSVLQPNERYLIGVSFPAKYLPNYNPSQSSGGLSGLGNILSFIALPIIAIIVIITVVSVARKSSYSSPKVSMETLGIKRGLTAVEASYLLDLRPTQIVTEILYSLLKKRAIWTQEVKPTLKLQVLPPYENKTGTKDNPLQYYEIDFLNALIPDGTINEEKLAHTIMFLRDTVEQKMQGYSRKDTIDYYRKIVTQAWTQVEQAGTVELASNAYDEQMLWLMLDPNQQSKTEMAFKDRPFQPSPLWFWWWYGYSNYYPNPTYKPNIRSPGQSVKPPTIPGAEFANNIATSVENTSNNIVVNLEKFANSIIPPPQKASHDPAHPKADCVCACAACACACACVSCACACAGGGVR